MGLSISLGMGIGITLTPISAIATLPNLSFQAETTALASSFSVAPTSRRKKSIDRAITRIKASGAWPKLTGANAGLWVIGNDEASWRINWANPGVNTLIKVGTPTFANNDGFTVASNAAYYDTNIALSAISQNNWSMGIYSKTSSNVASSDFGAQDATGNGITINTVTTTNNFVARLMSGVFTSNTTIYWGGIGWHGITRSNSTAVTITHHGIPVDFTNTKSVTVNSSNTFRIGGAGGNANPSARKLSAAYIANTALSATEEQELHAALLDYIDRCQYGDIDIYTPGVSPTIVTADVIVYGTTMAALCAAYEAKRQGRTVAIVGEPYVTSEWDIGGMPAAGLGSIDVADYTVVSGIFRQVIKWINTSFYNRTDANTQVGLSADSRAFRQAVRRMLDPSQVSVTLPAQDVPVYFSTGIKTVNKSGTTITSIVTNDGRMFNGKVFIGADYEGAMLPLAGIPYIIGTEATGFNGESLNGYSNTFIKLPDNVGNNVGYQIDPYIVSGNVSSGLLPDVINMPGLANNVADPGAQAMNFRLGLTKDNTRIAYFDSSAPPNYNANRYEVLGRMYSQNATISLSDNNILKQDNLFGKQYDINNGLGGISTDLPQSGVAYVNTASDLARSNVISDLRDFTRGFFYWHLQSGDVRIPATLKSQMNLYSLDAMTFLDPGTNPNNKIFWPNRAYVRDPIWTMKNSGFILTGNDTIMVDGTTPRSTNTVATISYFFADRHAARRVAFANGGNTIVYVQGGMSDARHEGVDQRSPMPLEALVPDANVCTNFLAPTTPSVSKIVWYQARMEHTLSMLGQSSGMIAAMAVANNTTVQNVSYSAFRTNMLAVPDSYVPVLPQLN